MRFNGDFQAVWRAYNPTQNEMWAMSRRGNALNATFQDMKNDKRINTTPAANPDLFGGTAVALGANGKSLIVWVRHENPVDPTSSTDIYGRMTDANGDPVGDEFRINSVTPANQTEPAVAVSSTGQNYVVAWVTESNDDLKIAARQFDQDGIALSA